MPRSSRISVNTLSRPVRRRYDSKTASAAIILLGGPVVGFVFAWVAWIVLAANSPAFFFSLLPWTVIATTAAFLFLRLRREHDFFAGWARLVDYFEVNLSRAAIVPTELTAPVSDDGGNSYAPKRPNAFFLISDDRRTWRIAFVELVYGGAITFYIGDLKVAYTLYDWQLTNPATGVLMAQLGMNITFDRFALSLREALKPGTVIRVGEMTLIPFYSAFAAVEARGRLGWDSHYLGDLAEANGKHEAEMISGAPATSANPGG